MINEKKLKEVIQEIIIWTGIYGKPQVKKMIEKKLNEAISLEEKVKEKN